MAPQVTRIFENKNILSIYILFCCVTSFGVMLVTVGGSWDITNHLLNKPETFFSPPHAFMYLGVTIALFAVIFSFLSWRRLEEKSDYKLSIKVMCVGIFLLVGAGPFDFIWHENFGLDGLLSPSHMTLIVGMLLCCTGAFFGISKYIVNQNNNKVIFLVPLAVLPTWLTASGMISALSLPFSNTEFFKFNPNPHLAVIVASLAFPFLISFSLCSAARLSKFRFGILSVTGVLFLMVNGFTGITTNQSISDTIGFYLLNIIPIVLGDFVICSDKEKRSMLFAGGLFGAVFSLVYYPYIVYTYNEVMIGSLVSPSMMAIVYYDLLPQIFSYTVISGMVLGLLGVWFSTKLLQFRSAPDAS